MFDDVSAPVPKLPLTEPQADAVQRLGRWMRIVGTIQLALMGMGLVILMLGFSCGLVVGAGAELIVPLIMIAMVAVALRCRGCAFKPRGSSSRTSPRSATSTTSRSPSAGSGPSS